MFNTPSSAICWLPSELLPKQQKLKKPKIAELLPSSNPCIARQVLWRRYCNIPAEHRHFYEVIRAGQPCHLYFDLEFMRVTNADTDGDALVDLLVELLKEFLE
jgi:hypothetical protein